MKNWRIIFGWIFLVNVTMVAGQVPTGFNYQGVARDVDGAVLANTPLEVTFAIHSGTEEGELVWEELHTITTDATGAFSLLLGNDPGKRTAGNALEFGAIDWSADKFFLKVFLDGSEVGTAQLMSVPYAAVAQHAVHAPEGPWTGEEGNLFFDQGNVSIGSTTAESRLTIQGDPDSPIDTALFVVKNTDGNPVFAVYNEGVRVYIKDSNTKGVKGGFAVGGYVDNKGILTNEFLRVTPDSVRIWINEPAGKGVKGGFAVGGYTSDKSEPTSFMQLDPENYFIGHEAGISNTEGIYNSFFGYQAGRNNTIGSQNNFIGYKSGFMNDSGKVNSFIGNHAGYHNRTGFNNIFIGDSSGYSNVSGYWNVFVGQATGRKNISGKQNVFVGDKAGGDNEIGEKNVFIGNISGWKNIDGNANVFIGSSSGSGNISGHENVFIGAQTGRWNETGNANVFLGRLAGYYNTTGSDNIYIGNRAGALNDTSYSNIFIGNNSGQANKSGLGNVFLGNRTGHENIDGSTNTFLGHESGHYRKTGDQNTFVGAYAGFQMASGYSNVLLGMNAGGSSPGGNDNTMLGTEAGFNNQGNGNVFLGRGAGYHEEGSEKLYIQNNSSDSANSLIYGDFANDNLTFNGRVGVNTASPWTELHVTSRTKTWAKLIVGEPDAVVGYSEFAGSASGSAGGSIRLGTSADFDDVCDYWQVSVWGENFQIGNPTNYAYFEIDNDGSIIHRGDELYADYVFAKDYDLESIEEHAERMWSDQHLPAVPPVIVDNSGAEVVDLGARNKGVLEELEKAHIYIEQLNARLKLQEEMIAELKSKVEALKSK
jgi:hypothetical protein